MIESIKTLTARLDYRRLSGVSSVLGIEFNQGLAYIVELKRHGNPFDSLSGSVRLVHSIKCALPDGNPENVAKALKETLRAHEIHTRYSVISVRGARIATTVVPPEVDTAEEWVQEHQAELLRLPVAPPDLTSKITELGRDARGTSVLVTFVRQSEIDECLKFASSAELELLGLSPGLEDLSRVCLLSLEGEPPSVYRIIHFGENTVNTLDFEGEHLIALETEHVSETLGAAEARLKGTTQNEDGTRKTFFSGRIPDQETGGIILRPFGLSSEFALAAGLALRGLMPNPHFADFLPPDEQAKSELRLSKSFFRRSATACCLFVLLLLGIPFGLASLIELRSDNLDARLAASGSSTREISELQKEAALLREVTLSTRTSALRSHAAFILHEIAAHTPEGVVLSQLTLSEAKSSITLKGTGKSQIDLSKFMKNLKTSPFCLDLSLTALNARSTLGVKPYTRSGSISFELSLTTRLGGGK